MNAERRKKLERLCTLIGDAKSLADELATEEQEAVDGLPANLQGSEKADAMREAVSSLEVARDYLENAEETLSELPGGARHET